MIKKLLAVAALAALTAAPAGAADKIFIGQSAGINTVPSLVAQHEGYFKEEGLDVELRPLARGGLAIEGLSSGTLQFAESAHVPFFAATDRGVPLIAVGVAARGFYGKLVASNANANLKTLADFKGKRIGTQMGTGMFTIVLMLLESQGLKQSDFQFTNLRVVDMPAAMSAASGNLDGVIGWEPGMQRIVNAGHGKVVISAKQFEEMASITYPFLLTTTQQYRKDHADIVQKVVNAYQKADKYIGSHKEETVNIYVDEIKRRGGKLTPDDVRVMLFDVDRYGGAAFTDGDMKDFPATTAYLVKTKQVKAQPDLKALIDTSFGSKALATAK
ncbi:MAG TPA: ABC transporter substrate-binding protein [Pseudolabrys sp.]|nr:ABC transporter substrate-binding protein [Pseudolabrys sp.]